MQQRPPKYIRDHIHVVKYEKPNYKGDEPLSSSCLYKGPRGTLDILRPVSQVVRTIWLWCRRVIQRHEKLIGRPPRLQMRLKCGGRGKAGFAVVQFQTGG